MPKVRLNYDGWLALPAAARRALGVDTGDQLEVEVMDGAVVLRPARKGVVAEPAPVKAEPAAAEPEAAEPEAATPEPALVAVPSPAAKRGPGRPRKAPPAALPPTLKTRGRRTTGPAKA